MRLVIDAGSVDEEADQSGVAHFLEHMLFNGTEEFPENELVATLRSFGASFGADVNAYTSYDETVYELTMPTQDDAVVATGMQILEQWLTSATLDPAQVEAERGVVLDEWRGSATSASGRIFDELETLLLTGSAYEGRDPIGTDDGDLGDDVRAAPSGSTTSGIDPTTPRSSWSVTSTPTRSRTLIRAEFEPVAVTGSLAERPDNRAEVPDRAGGDRPRRPRRRRRVRRGHPAARRRPPRDARPAEAVGQREILECDRVRDHRHPTRQRCPAR